MYFIHLSVLLLSLFLLNACGDEVKVQTATETTPKASEKKGTVQSDTAKAISQGTGGVAVTILPENPTSTGCLRAVIHGTPGRSSVVWSVNGEVVSSGTNAQLCSDKYKRDDTVTVEVGTDD